MLLSYIIPAYNCHGFISVCLDSLLAQGLPQNEYEVIVIDDGSTDGSADIIEEYCRKYPCFTLIRQENAGTGAARNTGLEQARGRYVMFVDADDRLLPQGMKVLFDSTVIPLGYPDAVSFWTRTVDRYYSSEWEVLNTPYSLRYCGDLKQYGLAHGVGFSVWTHIISRELLERQQLRFSNHKIGEDMLFMLNLYMSEGATLAVTNLNLYRYNMHDGSAINNTDKKHVISVFHSLMNLTERLERMKTSSDYPAALLDTDIGFCQRWAYTRLCSARLSYGEIKACLDAARKKHFFALRPAAARLNRFIALASGSAAVSYFTACIYGTVFIKYIKPLLRRN